MLETEMYRKLANDCIDRAQHARDDDAAAGMIRLAQFWMSKADDIDRKVERAERYQYEKAASFERAPNDQKPILDFSKALDGLRQALQS
jgi:hypothetical protein